MTGEGSTTMAAPVICGAECEHGLRCEHNPCPDSASDTNWQEHQAYQADADRLHEWVDGGVCVPTAVQS